MLKVDCTHMSTGSRIDTFVSVEPPWPHMLLAFISHTCANVCKCHWTAVETSAHLNRLVTHRVEKHRCRRPADSPGPPAPTPQDDTMRFLMLCQTSSSSRRSSAPLIEPQVGSHLWRSNQPKSAVLLHPTAAAVQSRITGLPKQLGQAPSLGYSGPLLRLHQVHRHVSEMSQNCLLALLHWDQTHPESMWWTLRLGHWEPLSVWTSEATGDKLTGRFFMEN